MVFDHDRSSRVFIRLWSRVVPIRHFSLIAISFLFVSCAFAGYAQLVPPAPLVLQPGGVTTVNFSSIPAANAPIYSGGHVYANASLNLGNRVVTVPVAMRVSANAAAFLATRLNPYVGLLSIASLAWPLIREWFKGDPVQPNLDVDPDGHIVVPARTIQPTFKDYRVLDWRTGQFVRFGDVGSPYSGYSCPGRYVATMQRTIDGIINIYPIAGGSLRCGNNVGVVYTFYCDNRWDPLGSPEFSACVTGGAPQPQVVAASQPSPSRLQSLEGVPIPRGLIPYLVPEIPVDPYPIVNPSVVPQVSPSTYPYIEPVTNPATDPLISPSANPSPVVPSQPFRVPNGDGVPIPNTSPLRYSQPWLEVTAAPTVTDPWRVSVTQIVTQEVTSIRDPRPVVYPTDCEKYPNTLGCTPLDSPPDESIPRTVIPLGLQSGAVLSGGGCPANLMVFIGGRNIQVTDASVACGWISSAKPVIILLALLSAITIVRPGGSQVRGGSGEA